VKKTLTLTLMISLGLFMVLSPVFIHLVSYLHPIVWVVILFCIICIVGFWVLLLRKEKIHIPYPIFLSFLTLYTIALVILLFLRPTDQIYKSINLVPFTTLIFYLSGKVNWLIAFYNLAANIVLFIPYGLFLRMKRFSQWKTLFIALLMIACIEVLQFIFHRGSMDIDDLILNLLGVYLGFVLFRFIRKVVHIVIF